VDGAEGSVTVEPAEAGKVAICIEATDLKVLPGVLARVRRVFDLSADPDAIARDLSADPVLKPLVEARPGLRLPGAWIDGDLETPSDRLPAAWADETLSARAEAWRPWRAYGALYLTLAGISGVELMERDDAKRAA
jgi:AraC family transcriptional regulator of adaptative response / DNA-3-methyladenine glycosylase II